MKILRPQIISSRSGSYRTGRWTAHWRPTRHDRPPLNQSPIDTWGLLTSVTDGCSLFCFNIYQTLQPLRFVLETRGPRQSASEPSNAAPKTSILYGLLCTVPRRKDGCCLQTIPSPLIHHAIRLLILWTLSAGAHPTLSSDGSLSEPPTRQLCVWLHHRYETCCNIRNLVSNPCSVDTEYLLNSYATMHAACPESRWPEK